MSVDFLYEYLPSFFKNFMVDASGNRILDPLFQQYTNCIGDILYQAQQLSQCPYIDTCPLFFIEYFKTIDVTADNAYLNGFKLESDNIGFSGLYLDGNFNIQITQTFSILNDSTNNTRYIVFSAALDPRVNTLYAPSCYKHKNMLYNIFGKVLNYQPILPFLEYGPDFITQQQTYKNQLLAILFCSINGQTYQSIKQSLSIFLGLQYSPFNAIVRDNSGTSITLEDIVSGNLTTINGNINSSLVPGVSLNKYDVLENDLFYLYDIFSDPARFTQYILSNNSTNLLNLLNIDLTNDEQYAFLTYDSVADLDATGLYWDMGNNTGVDHSVPSGASDISLPSAGLVTTFGTYNDSRFNSQKIYEMFRNVFIIEFYANQSDANITNINYFLTRFKPIYTKYLLYNPASSS